MIWILVHWHDHWMISAMIMPGHQNPDHLGLFWILVPRHDQNFWNTLFFVLHEQWSYQGTKIQTKASWSGSWCPGMTTFSFSCLVLVMCRALGSAHLPAYLKQIWPAQAWTLKKVVGLSSLNTRSPPRYPKFFQTATFISLTCFYYHRL